jgi:hypothetical protein
MNREEAMEALTQTDWTDATIEREQRPVSIVHSVRFPAELSQRLEAEAQRRGLTPSALVRELVEVGLNAAAGDAVVTVRVADLHRAIDVALHRAA